ncbi:MAG: serine/threonine protein kinase [Betaproteobacteria bacterium]|nr:serine/threonine protein kinase [Betaproteobacteria bacterium]
MSTRGRAILLSVTALLVSGVLWWALRAALEARLIATAQRDLHTIVDLVSLDLDRLADDAPALHGSALLAQASRTNRELAATLARVSDENFRSIHFFDAAGEVVRIGGTAPGDIARSSFTPEIVRQARSAGLAPASARQGALFDPYHDVHQREVVGVWRWIAARELGIVAERPYDRFIQPIRWIDATFGIALLLGVLAFIFLTRVDLRELRAAFRRSDISACGPYEIKRLIGEGAMANVYLAEHTHLKRVVALKRLKIHAQSDELLERFDREARLASQLAHPNIITVLDHGSVPGGGFYYAMEFIRGLTLTQWVEQHGPLPPARAVRILRQICAAVGAMHQRQLLHRDIKPDNVMAYAAHGDYDLVKLLDFGLIKDLEHTATRDLSRDARVLGTPAFMAPERLVDPRIVDRRTDLYGIGCIGFYLLAGRKPFEAGRDADLVQQIQHIQAPAVSSLSIFAIPQQLDQLIANALAKNMELRPADAEDFDAALKEIERQAPWHREQARLWWMSVFPA